MKGHARTPIVLSSIELMAMIGSTASNLTSVRFAEEHLLCPGLHGVFATHSYHRRLSRCIAPEKQASRTPSGRVAHNCCEIPIPQATSAQDHSTFPGIPTEEPESRVSNAPCGRIVGKPNKWPSTSDPPNRRCGKAPTPLTGYPSIYPNRTNDGFAR
jgi:hypothetical protein